MGEVPSVPEAVKAIHDGYRIAKADYAAGRDQKILKHDENFI